MMVRKGLKLVASKEAQELLGGLFEEGGKTAEALVEFGAEMYNAGLWKGAGVVGLVILACYVTEVAIKTGIKSRKETKELCKKTEECIKETEETIKETEKSQKDINEMIKIIDEMSKKEEESTQ